MHQTVNTVVGIRGFVDHVGNGHRDVPAPTHAAGALQNEGQPQPTRGTEQLPIRKWNHLIELPSTQNVTLFCGDRRR
ncbi:hypothetical protein MRX96_058698 [Rhipicephalus microplus]